MTRRYVVLGIGAPGLPTTAETLYAYRRRFMHALVDRSGATSAPEADRAERLADWMQAHHLQLRGDWVADWLAQTVHDWRQDRTRRAVAWIGPQPLSADRQRTDGPAPTMRLDVDVDVRDGLADAEAMIDIRFDWAARRYLGDSPRTIAADEAVGPDDDPRALANQIRQTADSILATLGLAVPMLRRGRPKPRP